MTKKKISLVLIIIIISTVLILGGTLTWGFLTEWGQKNKSSAPTEIEVGVEIEEEPEKEIKKEVEKEIKKEVDKEIKKEIKKEIEKDQETTGTERSPKEGTTGIKRSPKLEQKISKITKIELSMKTRDQGSMSQVRKFFTVKVNLIQPEGDVRTVKNITKDSNFTDRSDYKRSDSFYNFDHTFENLNWVYKCKDQINMEITTHSTSGVAVAIVKDVKLTVYFNDRRIPQIFTDLSPHPTNSYKEINGHRLPYVARAPYALYTESTLYDVGSTTDYDEGTLTLPYSKFPPLNSTTYVAPKKWILCNTCNARDHCIKPCEYQSSTEKNWCYLNEDSKGICKIDGNAGNEYNGQDGSPWSYSPCCQKENCRGDCKKKNCTDRYNKNWCYLKDDPEGKCKIDGNPGKAYTGNSGSPWTASAPCGRCRRGPIQTRIIGNPKIN